MSFPPLPANSQPKASVVHRVIAKFIDLFFIFILAGVLPYPAGPLMGFFYSLFGDGMKGRSLGKHIMRLKVVQVKSRRAATYRDSLLRNSPIGIATFFGIIPIWGWLILALIGLPLMAIEVYLMATVPMGHRLGDVMSDTEVIELKGRTGV